jgi:hypothetical protein
VYRKAQRERHKWLDRIEQIHSAIWWVRRGCLPAAEDARHRLLHVLNYGPSPFAFTFAHPFPPPLAPTALLRVASHFPSQNAGG